MKALLDIPQEVNQTLNIIKAQHNFKNKVETISFIVEIYKKEHMEPELQPKFVQKLQKTEHQRGIQFHSVDDMRKRYA